MVCKKCRAEIIAPEHGLRSRAVLCPACLSPVTPLARLLTTGVVLFGLFLPGIALVNFLRTPNLQQRLHGSGNSELPALWRVSLIALQEHFSTETAAVLLTLEALVVGLVGSFVFYQVLFYFIKPLGAGYREATETPSPDASGAGAVELVGINKLALGEFEPQFGAAALIALARTVEIPIIEYGLPVWVPKIRNPEELQKWGVAVARANRGLSDERGIYIILEAMAVLFAKIPDINQFESWISNLSSVYRSLPTNAARQVVGYAIPTMANSIHRPASVFKKDLWAAGLKAEDGPDWRGKRIPSKAVVAQTLDAIERTPEIER